MVPLPDENSADPLLIQAGPYPYLPYDRDAWKGELPPGDSLIPISPFRFIVERKLYLHNMGHAVCAYLGMERGYHTIADAIEDPEIRWVVREAMTESACALAGRYRKGVDELLLYSEDLMRRFGNRALGDTCERVGRDIPRKLARTDRLTGTALSVLGAGGHPVYIAIGAAAALNLSCAENPASFLTKYSQLADGEYYHDTLAFSSMLCSRRPLSDLIRRADTVLSERVGMVM